jgi:arabinose-5-phosphate isomerase
MGVGKSGNIAKKISATMVSTGTSSIFLDPSEAMHGGLGVLQPNDVIFAIGKSGESAEMNDLIKPIRQIGCKIIALTANKESTLAMAADISLYTRIDIEACPLDLAPTSSTTVALVAGDAIAITLMKMKGIQSETFGLYHPGGRLGRRLLWRVRDLMHSGERNPTVRISADTSRMLVEISRQMVGAVSVVDAQMRLKGLVTDFDIRKVLERGGIHF